MPDKAVPTPANDDATAQVNVVAVNMAQRLAALEDGQILPITTMLDEDGNETDDASAAAVVVAGTDDFGWIVLELDTFPSGLMH